MSESSTPNRPADGADVDPVVRRGDAPSSVSDDRAGEGQPDPVDRPSADADALRRRLCEEHARNALVLELTRRGATRPEQAATLLADRLTVELDAECRPTLLDGDRPADVAQVVGEWLAENRHFLPAATDTGSGARKGVGPGGGPSLAALDADPARKARFIAEHGAQAYLRLARRSR